MPGTWDSKLKLLVNKTPQDFVSWLVEGATYEAEVSPHLKSRNIDADVLYQIRMNDRSCLLHIEFQSQGDSDMAMRVWEYNVLATCQNQLPVYSFIVYLKKTGNCVTPPFVYQDATAQDIHRFHFGVIKLWEVPTAWLKNLGLKGVLPLLLLTREGQSRAVVDDIITGLSENSNQPEIALLSLTYGLASMILQAEDDQDWLKRRFSMIKDEEWLEESWLFREWVQKGVDQGLVSSRRTLLTLVEHRYPSLMDLARAKAAAI